jgi:fibronectin-binding autotransporter adhesin
VLSGDSVYTGPTSVDAGLLKITGSLGNSAVSVNNTGTLGGTGTIAGSVTVNTGGTLAPGNSLGVLGTGELTLAGGSVLSIEANGTTVSTQYDQVNVTGGVSIAGNLAVALGYTPTLGDNLFIINNDGSDAVGGGFANLGVGNTVDLAFNSVVYRFAVSYTGDFGSRSTTGGNDVVLTNVLVPEPSTLALIAFSALGLTRRRRDA